MQRVYASKRDGWIVALLWIAVVGMLVAAAQAWQDTNLGGFRLVIAPAMVLMAGFVVWLLYGTGYTLTDTEIVVRSGPLRWRVPLAAIQEVFPTHNPLSSPACSLDRLRIRYEGSRFGVMISPAEKAAFLRDLVARSPGLELRGDSVVRGGG